MTDSIVRHSVNFVLVVSLALSGACEVNQTKEAEMPEVEVKGGQLPKYDVETAEVDATMEKKKVQVPDVEVTTKEAEIEVPDVEVTMPGEGEEEPSDRQKAQ